MTSKEIIKELRKEIDKILQTGKSLRSYRIYQYLDMLEKFNPTLSECIKEWEEKGFIVNNQFKDYQYYTISSGYFDMEDILIYISLNSVNEFYYSLEGHLNIELNELLHKTLKALEEEKDENS